MNTIPNFDCMSAEELLNFWSKYNRATRKDAAELIGDKRKGYLGITSTLVSYAMAKNCAMKLRLEGEIQRATVYEQHCEIYYQTLPEDLRW